VSLSPLNLALQGLFPFSPIAAAVQALLASSLPPAPEPQPQTQPRPAIVGRGPGTTINYSQYFAPAPRKLQPTHTAQQRLRTLRRRQRREEEVISLLDL
jgi:hypothetical protein